ncbi:MAG TPA: PepSY domain-containing protein [Hyphomicrobium sp.]|nr:PepSY domain-containing protein [Hyphomicrobium sp.]
MPLIRVLFFLAAVLIAAPLGGAARADDIGPEVAKRLLKEGRIKPLTEILAAVNAKVPGELLEVELEIEDGIYVYEFKLLRPDGRVQEVEADASTAKILKIEDDD